MKEPIKLINSNIIKYKKLSDLSIDLDNGITTIVGENGVGKTSLLESLLYHSRSGYSLKEPCSIIHTVVINTKAYDSLSGYKFKNELIIKFKLDHDKHYYKIIEINGIENYINQIRKRITKLEEDIKNKSHEMLSVIKELSKVQELYHKRLFDNNSNHRSFINPIRFLPSHIDELIKIFQKYITGDEKIISFDEKCLNIINEDLRFRFDYYYDVNKEEFFNSDRYKEFKEYYNDCTIEEHGIEVDFVSLDRHVTKINEQYLLLKQLLIRTKVSFYDKQQEAYTLDEDLYKIIDDVAHLKKELKQIIMNYFNGTAYIQIQIDEFTMIKDVNEENKNKLLDMIGIQVNEKLEKSQMSDGELWCIKFVEAVSNLSDCLLLIDEPGMFLNPVLQSRLIKVFRYLNSKNIKVIYTTHSNFMIDFDYNIGNYILKENEGNITIDKLVLSDYSFLSNISIGELILYSAKKIIIVEGPTDMVFYSFALSKLFDVDTSNYNFVDGSGDGVISMIEFCMKNKIEYKAIIDRDKKDFMNDKLGKQMMHKHENKIYFIGDPDEIEDLFTDSDLKLLCRDKKDSIEMKLNRRQIKECFSIDKYKHLSEKLRKELKRAFEHLQII